MDQHREGRCFIYGPKYHKENWLLSPATTPLTIFCLVCKSGVKEVHGYLSIPSLKKSMDGNIQGIWMNVETTSHTFIISIHKKFPTSSTGQPRQLDKYIAGLNSGIIFNVAMNCITARCFNDQWN